MGQERQSPEPHRNDLPGEITPAPGAAGEQDLVAGDEVDDAGLESGAMEHASRTAPASTAGQGPIFVQFLRASWAELQRVHWPNRSQVSQATAVVLGFVVVTGVYFGIADWVAQKIVNIII